MIKVYYCDLHLSSYGSFIENGLGKVNENRRIKVNKCKNPENKVNSLGAGLLLRYALENAGYRYDNLNFFNDEYGAIRIDNVTDLFISISHSNGFAACALSDTAIGVDIEKIDRFEKVNFIKRCYTQREQEFVSEDTSHFEERCAVVWTRKEAYSKQKGLGMRLDFKNIDTMNINYFYDYQIQENMQLSVCSDDKNVMDTNIIKVDVSDL